MSIIDGQRYFAHVSHAWIQAERAAIISNIADDHSRGKTVGSGWDGGWGCLTDFLMLQPRSDTHHFCSELICQNWLYSPTQPQGDRNFHPTLCPKGNIGEQH